MRILISGGWVMGMGIVFMLCCSGQEVSLPVHRKGPPAPQETGQYFADLAGVQVKHGFLSRAREAYERAVRATDDAAQKAGYAVKLGEICLRLGDAAGAVRHLEAAVAAPVDPATEFTLCSMLASAYERAGKHDAAEKAFLRGIERAHEPAQKRLARNQLLLFYRRTDRLQGFIREQEVRLAKDANDAEALAMLAEVYWVILREPAKALAFCERLARAQPEDPEVAQRLAYVYQVQKQHDRAVETLERLAAMDPDRKRVYQERISHIYATSGQMEKAVGYAEKLVEAAPEDASAQARLAAIYEQAKRPKDALVAYEKAASLATSWTNREQYWLQLAEYAGRHKAYEKAEAAARRLAQEGRSKDIRARANRLLFDLYEK
jgi:tetratricopeptide (TPR) repeat protein